ncbi:iron uptake transporter deferrochelatase/peroxidase subunit [Paracoccus marinus]|uniref:iron uptake transporter deferrochelatase/peroxidase subunit n=1 Tax=Paracoccus marinus TaxID=288426 RepID=UPI001039D2BA|nr:iron uptake transporter deferrochelatase/peroxidase subunit [Paracoccus marinus]GLS80293.1 Tat-translocated enzyme [Paracoccus marinus]
MAGGHDPTRRTLLRGFGAAAMVCPFAAGMARAEGNAAPDNNATGQPRVTQAPQANESSPGDYVSPYGAHQAGIVTPRPAHGMVASFHVLADTPADLERLLRRLGERIAFLTRGGEVPQVDPGLPPADSGLLGPVIRPDALTITVALGADLFDRHDWLSPHRPRQLVRMPKFPNDAPDASILHGDLALQICANTQDATIHALRDIIKSVPDQLLLAWKQEGSVPVIPPRPAGEIENARNFLGFRDGSANPDASDAAQMDRIVWVGAAQGEPGWTHGGSYAAVRIIRNFVERWDRTPLAEQERIMGRVKSNGAPLDRRHATEMDVPDYEADPDGEATAMDAHIRLANPRTPDSRRNLILRRPFNYSNGVTKSGQLDQGLLFICWQADLAQGFVAVQDRLNGEPLEEYIKPVGGGFFFALPGFTDAPDDYPGRQLIGAIGRTTAPA